MLSSHWTSDVKDCRIIQYDQEQYLLYIDVTMTEIVNNSYDGSDMSGECTKITKNWFLEADWILISL